MSQVFYHDPLKRVVIRGPAEPTVRERKKQNGDSNGWEVKTTFTITSATNYVKSDGQWAQTVSDVRSEKFPETYSREEVSRHFKLNRYPPLRQIDETEYTLLESLYNKQAWTNKGPCKG